MDVCLCSLSLLIIKWSEKSMLWLNSVCILRITRVFGFFKKAGLLCTIWEHSFCDYFAWLSKPLWPFVCVLSCDVLGLVYTVSRGVAPRSISVYHKCLLQLPPARWHQTSQTWTLVWFILIYDFLLLLLYKALSNIPLSKCALAIHIWESKWILQ